ncbi:shikimate dehydrogenase [Bacillota bacterium LX-D]|nr:shikimate dehydrogenase [Bacillota bacterium LX-D]
MKIKGDTVVMGIIGYPLKHSLSPIMHNVAFKALNLNYVYVPFPIKPDNLVQTIKFLPKLGIKGVNITIPYKEEILNFLDEISEDALLIGAVNTVVIKEEKMYGYNTDGNGFYQSLIAAGFNPDGKKVLIAGAGGACRAVAFTLCKKGISDLNLAVRSFTKAEALANDLNSHFSTDIKVTYIDNLTEEEVSEADLIINTTPVGMYPQVNDLAPLKVKFLHSNQFVCDLIYNPFETKLLQEARKKGCRTLNGLGMLVYQGAEAFSYWTGQEAPIDLMSKAVLKSLLNN